MPGIGASIGTTALTLFRSMRKAFSPLPTGTLRAYSTLVPALARTPRASSCEVGRSRASTSPSVILCWLIQSQENRTVDKVEAILRATFDKVLRDLRADPIAF